MPPEQAGSVLHLSACDDFGGSGRAAYRLHRSLRQAGWTSRMLVARRVTTDPDVARIWRSQAWRILDRACGEVTDWLSWQYLFYPSSYLLPFHPWLRQADLVQLYNLHGGYFSLPALLALDRPLVWRLSDMWPLTGHCTFSYDCQRWMTGCGHCPILSDDPGLRRDTTAMLWRMKRHVYSRCRNLTVVSPSRWLAGRVQDSPLLQHCPVVVIPPGVDVDVFHPMPKAAARQQLGLPTQGRLVLFSARSLGERRKGSDWLKPTMARLWQQAEMADVRLLTVGGDVPDWMQSDRVSSLGFVSDDARLAAAYAAADVLVLPTLADNLPNALIESLACGTPCVAFDAGGCSEVVKYPETGYLAKPADADDLLRGLQLLLADQPLREAMGQRGRRLAAAEHASDLQAQRYADLYWRLIPRDSRPDATPDRATRVQRMIAEEARCAA